MYKAFLIKYAEIGIKGKNRYLFENALRDQIKFALRWVEGRFRVSKEQGRIFVEAMTDYDYEETIEALQKVFGITGICPVVVIEDNNWELLCKAVGDHVEAEYPNRNFTFKVAAKRGDKSYPKTSPEICMDMGDYLLDRFHLIK